MSDNTQNNKRIAKNTLMLYIRMLFLMFINLYTSRVILKALGIEDYGIYNAVGGFVAMFSIISSSLSTAISRFITFELGKGDAKSINKLFSTTVIIQLFISTIAIILISTIGIWFLNTKMTIPADRMIAANWVFILSAITFLTNLMSVPYNASIIAHERMDAFAYIGIVDAIGRLFVSYLIIVSPIDKLITYAILLCLLSITIRFLYIWYCKNNFEECKFKWIIDTKSIKEIFSFAGWNFIGASSGILKEQGVNILLNIFCGPAINAARGIAVQVSTAVTQFSQNFITAINPQITKSYANKNHAYMMFLLEKASKLSYFMLFTLSLPIIINAPYILSLWLGNYPDFSVVFVRLILLVSIHEAISAPLITAMLATGRIRNYQIIVGGIQFLNLPLSYIALRLNYSPEIVYIIALLVSFACFIARIYMLRKMINLNISSFIKNVYLKIILVSAMSFIISYMLTQYINNGVNGFVVSTSICVALSLANIYTIGCNKTEREYINKVVKGIKYKIFK
jgi:O-antigen/teichoic acid export membrane protein